MTEEFHISQRWYSHTEAELGLGIVTELINRRVVILFPASGEERTYAQDNAPLSRIIYPIGDEISSDEGVTMTISSYEHSRNCVIYIGEDAQGDEQIIHEASLESSVHFSQPYERLFAGQIDKLRHYELRMETLKFQHQHQQSAAYGLIGPRVQYLPHQFYIAAEVGQRIAPRVLLADEVGLGKTIEAGLILHQQLVSGLASRVLIVVPDSLIHQWLVEMLRRFNLHFSIIDEARCNQNAEDLDSLDELDEQMVEAESNPFESAQYVLSPLSLFTGDDKYLQQAIEAGWDLLVVDEAHHLGWSEEGASHAYNCIEQLATHIKGLLLLTATPEQLGVESHFARLRLLDPARYYDLESFIDEEADFQKVNQLIEQLQNPEQWPSALLDKNFVALLHQYLGDQVADQLESYTEPSDERDQFIESSIRALLDQHGTGRVLFRNTRDSVKGFPQRQLHTYPLEMPEVYQTLSIDSPMDKRLHPETLLPAESGAAWLAEDSRAEWLTSWLREQNKDKVLIICAHAKTAITLEKKLRLFEGIRTALFHEGMSLIERDRAAAYFAETEQGAQVLICSEIGSEGRNFQFAHNMVMFDLPLNPDLLEQRIGRLDRIGQRQDVQIHVPYFEDTAQEVLLRWYSEGLAAFESVCPTGQILMQEFAAELHHCMEEPSDHQRVEQLIDDTAQSQMQLIERMQNGRDKLLELNSCNESQASQLLSEVEEMSQSVPLSSYMGRVFDHFGVEQESNGVNGLILHPGDHMLCSHFPGLSSDGMSVTFQRQEALSREDMHYLSWEHPMVKGGMEMMLEGGYGTTSLCSMKLLPLKAGSLLVEAIFRIHCVANKELQLQRYLSDAWVRRVMDSNGNDLSEVITEQHFATLGKRVGKNVAYNLVKHTREDISQLVEKLEASVEDTEQQILTEARNRLQQQQNEELQRLIDLSKVNPNIRQEEITALQLRTEKMLEILDGASLKMDAIRIAIVTHD